MGKKVKVDSVKKLAKVEKKELKKEKNKLKAVEKEIKKTVKKIGKLGKEIKKEEKELLKFQKKKDTILVALKLHSSSAENGAENTEDKKPQTAAIDTNASSQ